MRTHGRIHIGKLAMLCKVMCCRVDHYAICACSPFGEATTHLASQMHGFLIVKHGSAVLSGQQLM
jgi:hypothetical protein